MSLQINNADISEDLTEIEISLAYLNGIYEFKIFPEVIVSANKDWKLGVRIKDIESPAGVNKNEADFKLKHDQFSYSENGFFGNYKSLSSSIITIASGKFQIKEAIFTISYAMDINEDKDILGSYRATFEYTLSTEP